GKMIPAELEKAIVAAKIDGAVPFFVNATGGTTVYGAYDPIDEIADVCEKHNIWLHVDCAWGGGVLVSSKHKHLVKGIHRADSVTWNPHKMLGVTLQCSAILLKHKDLLAHCNSMCADYLFQQDKNYDVSYDTGDKAIQCGRHNDIFKFWLMWRAKGDAGLESHINRLFDLKRYMLDRLAAREGFEMVLEEPECTNICFWYVPRSMRKMAPGPDRDYKLNLVAPRVKGLMMEAGTTMIGYQPHGNQPNFFRMIISNNASTKSDIDFLLDEIERLGEEASSEI
ncbi:glutamate decarboxylase 1-like, partial [Lingula anatina]|uniref:Glutamate decarboxylase 1-like n=1 Tax=Lingula anatina TaxID=7574 RepID=A0A2R2MMY6_LINAN